MEAKAGDQFLGKMIRGYKLEELLGRGRLTAVYRARTEELWLTPELVITILLVPDTLVESVRTRFRARFMREARQLALLRHQYLFPLYGYGEQDGLFYLLTPPMQGETLTQHLRQKGRWNSLEILSLLYPLANVLDFVHSQGLVYQFFSPVNVVLQRDRSILLSSLGLSQLLSLAGLEDGEAKAATNGVLAAKYEHLKSVTETFLGMPEYLAPEVVQGARADGRSDVYALGILLFELLGGRPPFIGTSYQEIAQKHVREPLPSLHEIAPELPFAIEIVVNRALHRNPERRFQTLNEFVTAYAHVVEERNTLSRPTSLTQIVRALPMPKPERAIAWQESGFLLEGKDTLFPNMPAPPLAKEVAPGESDLPGTALIPSRENKPVPIAENILHAMTQQRPISQQTERREIPGIAPSEIEDEDQMDQKTTKLVNMSSMMGRLQTLKQRLENQSVAHAYRDKADGQRPPESLHE